MTNNILLFIIVLSIAFSSPKAYWDLGVIIIDEEPRIVQQEVDLDIIDDANYNKENIKALHSNNFIPPVLYDLKMPSLLSGGTLKKYDDFIYSLSISETMRFFKKSFLNNQYSNFFETHKLLNKENMNDELVTSMYVQKLYNSNQLDRVEESLNNIPIDSLTDELLLYKIKVDIKLKNYEKAQQNIQLFIEKFEDSDLLRYVIYENKLLINKNK